MSNIYRPLIRIAEDPDALEAFYRDHVDEVQGFIARRLDDPHLVADLVGEVFLAAIDAADRYSPSGAPVIAWLYGIARNVVASEVRRRRREHHALVRMNGRRRLDGMSLTQIEDRIDAERASRRLYRAMEHLSEGDRALLELVALDGLSVADAATSLGVKPATARVRLHRIRTRLNTHLRAAGLPAAALTQEVTT